MAQSYLRTPSVERLPVILEELYNGYLCILPFLRNFEWTGEQRLALFSSIKDGLPTGSLLVWRISHKLASENTVGPFPLNPSRAGGERYLLDGRQRMTTLFAALGAGFWTRNGLHVPQSEYAYEMAPDGTPWSIAFNLETEDFEFEPRDPHGQRSLFPDPARLPLRILFDDNAFHRWYGEVLTRDLANRARAVRSAFMDYLIPVIPLATDDIGVATMTFKRVNSGGTPVSETAMVRALVWSKDFDLRDHIDKVRERLEPLGWAEVEEDAILRVVAVTAGIDPNGFDMEELAGRLKQTPNVVEDAGKFIEEAVKFLKQETDIRGPGALPYKQVLVFVARAFYQASGALTPAQQETLRGWIVEACIDERFSGAPRRLHRAAWRTLAARLLLIPEDSPNARDDRPLLANECRRFSMAWARSRTTALVLAGQQPKIERDVLVNEPFELVARGNQGIHMLLTELPPSVRKRFDLALHSPANRVVCPAEQMPALRRALLRPDCPAEVRDSHLIDKEAHDALLTEDLETFFERRRRAILDAERRWVEAHGGKVDLQLDPRPYT